MAILNFSFTGHQGEIFSLISHHEGTLVVSLLKLEGITVVEYNDGGIGFVKCGDVDGVCILNVKWNRLRGSWH